MTTATATTRQQQAAYADRVRHYASDPFAFAADLHVPLGSNSGRLSDHWADFQRRDFAALSPALLAVARGEVAPQRRFWIERTKGGSKDSDCAVAILWLLVFAPRSVRVQVGAYDKEQASELRYIVKAILEIDAPLNRLLASVVEVQRDRIIAHAGTPGRSESVCEILTTDAYGSHGARPDVVVANELSHVGSQAFMETLFDNADKVPHSLVIVATNAGEVGTWQEKWRDIARESDRWHYSELNEPAPWVNEADLAESQLRNPVHRYNRLWRGIWSSGDGEGLDPADIAACVTLDGPQPFREDRLYVLGLDLGLRHDRAAAAVLAADPLRETVELAHIESWRASDFAGGEIDLNAVQTQLVALCGYFRVGWLLYDPWQAALLAQNLRRLGIDAVEQPFTPKRKDIMAKALIEATRNRLIHLYTDSELERDLLRLKIKEGPVGFRLDAMKDADGHADKAIALSIGLPEALYVAREYIGQCQNVLPQQVVD